VQVGPLLRDAITSAVPRDEGYVVSYLRRHTPFSAIEALADCGMPVRVYGLGHRDHVGNVSFHTIDERRFIDDLAGCSAVVAAAGNQLIGESLHLGKPLLALPERAHAEQMMNSHFLASMGCGQFVLLEDITRDKVRAFLDDQGRFRPALAPLTGRMDGTPDVLQVIRHRLATPDAGRITAGVSPDAAGSPVASPASPVPGG
jgi:uncharacterized protein (TIGR00661 family)